MSAHWPRIARTRPHRVAITRGSNSDVDAPAAPASPPGVTEAARRPSPSERRIEAPCTALVGHEAPGLAGDPHVPVVRRVHPVAVAIRLPPGIGSVIG